MNCLKKDNFNELHTSCIQQVNISSAVELPQPKIFGQESRYSKGKNLSMNDGSSEIGHDLRKQSGQKNQSQKIMFLTKHGLLDMNEKCVDSWP